MSEMAIRYHLLIQEITARGNADLYKQMIEVLRNAIAQELAEI